MMLIPATVDVDPRSIELLSYHPPLSQCDPRGAVYLARVKYRDGDGDMIATIAADRLAECLWPSL